MALYQIIVQEQKIPQWGIDHLNPNTTASYNTAVGFKASEENTTGNDNTSIGYETLQDNTTGSGNTAVGLRALQNNTTANSNTAVGKNALRDNTTGTQQVAIGTSVLKVCTTGTQNTAVGENAGIAVTTGGQNVIVGRDAGASITTGSYNVCLGPDAGKSHVVTDNNQLYIARNTDSAGNDGCWIHGSSSGRCYNGDNDSHWYTTSDERLKKDIVDNTAGLSIINQIKVKNFKYKQYKDGSPVTTDDTVDLSEFPKADNVKQVLIGQGKTETRLGIIAQDLESVLPNSIDTSTKGVKTILTDELFWHMINAIKELSAKVTALEGK